MPEHLNKVRIQKLLASAGFGSRRACELLVLEGRVTVNGQTADQLPVLVDPEKDDVRVDGRRVKPIRLVYFLLHKPKGVLCTNNDPGGRVRAVDLLRGVKERVYPVGRLDADSTGLLLMTNDGELTERLTHPRYGIEKTYEVMVRSRLKSEDAEKLKRGVWLAEGKTQPVRIRIIHRGRDGTLLEARLREGRNREVRRMLAQVGYKVTSLKRIRLGSLSIRGLGVGRFRPLTSTEVTALHKLTLRADRPALKNRRPQKKG